MSWAAQRLWDVADAAEHGCVLPVLRDLLATEDVASAIDRVPDHLALLPSQVPRLLFLRLRSSIPVWTSGWWCQFPELVALYLVNCGEVLPARPVALYWLTQLQTVCLVDISVDISVDGATGGSPADAQPTPPQWQLTCTAGLGPV